MVDVIDYGSERKGPCFGPGYGDDSTMRQFLEHATSFLWSNGTNECTFKPNDRLPLVFERKIDDHKSADALIDQYRIESTTIPFSHSFAVKQIKGTSRIESRRKAQQEVKNMRNLRHPHVAALLATFMHQERLNILIFPAACCDLGDFMKDISTEYKTSRSLRGHTGFVELDRTYTQSDANSVSSSARERMATSGTLSEIDSIHPELHVVYSWPLRQTLLEKVKDLGRFFLCLCQALEYLHRAGVRHKDIKPENILVDFSGNVVVTDFGISRRFPKGVSHGTEEKPVGTRVYLSPETAEKRRRDDPSDIFSLGCVFTEMATLVLGRDLDQCRVHRTSKVNGVDNWEFWRNLPKVYTWLDALSPRDAVGNVTAVVPNGVNGEDNPPSLEQEVAAALPTIRSMLSLTEGDRPVAAELWRKFNFTQIPKCRDCNPDHPDVWKPSDVQRSKDAEEGERRRSRRRSMIAIPEGRPIYTVSQEARGAYEEISPAARSRAMAQTEIELVRSRSAAAKLASPLQSSLRNWPNVDHPSHGGGSRAARGPLSNARPSNRERSSSYDGKRDPRLSSPPSSPKSVKFGEEHTVANDRAMMPPPRKPIELQSPSTPLIATPVSRTPSVTRSITAVVSQPGPTAPMEESSNNTTETTHILLTRPTEPSESAHFGLNNVLQQEQDSPPTPIQSVLKSHTTQSQESTESKDFQAGNLLKRHTTRSQESAESKDSRESNLVKRHLRRRSLHGKTPSSPTTQRDGQLECPKQTPIASPSSRASQVLYPTRPAESQQGQKENKSLSELPKLGFTENIILFDVEKKLVYVTKFAALHDHVKKGNEWRRCDLPPSATHFDAAENDKTFIQARVNLNKQLGMIVTFARRWLNAYPDIYLINFSQAPRRSTASKS